MTKATPNLTFGTALRAARTALRIHRSAVAKACDVEVRTVSRWEANETWPSLENRFRILHLAIDLPWEELHELARLAKTTVEHAGIQETPNPDDAVARAAAHAPPPAGPTSVQKAIDDAIREAAEDLAIHARDLRPVASRLIDAIARSGVALDSASRMVLGVPKRPARPGEAGSTRALDVPSAPLAKETASETSRET